MTANLSSLARLSDYRETRQHIFPSKGSIDWFLREHRDEMISANALLMISGQWHVDPDKFDAAVVAIGSAAAKRRIGEAA